MDFLFEYYNSLGPTIFIIFFCIFLLLLTAVIFVILKKLPFARIYHRLSIHYKEKCNIFAIPPIGYESTINKTYGYGRINAIIIEYFLFLGVVVFISTALIWTVLLNIGLTSINNIQIYAADGYQLAVLIMNTKLALLLFLIIIPHLVMNPITDSILVSLIVPHHKVIDSVDWKKFFPNLKYISLETIYDNFKSATIPTLFFYLSFKIYILIIAGKLFILENIFSINVLSIMFILAILLSCRSVALSEMFKDF